MRPEGDSGKEKMNVQEKEKNELRKERLNEWTNEVNKKNDQWMTVTEKKTKNEKKTVIEGKTEIEWQKDKVWENDKDKE